MKDLNPNMTAEAAAEYFNQLPPETPVLWDYVDPSVLRDHIVGWDECYETVFLSLTEIQQEQVLAFGVAWLIDKNEDVFDIGEAFTSGEKENALEAGLRNVCPSGWQDLLDLRGVPRKVAEIQE